MKNTGDGDWRRGQEFRHPAAPARGDVPQSMLLLQTLLILVCAGGTIYVLSLFAEQGHTLFEGGRLYGLAAIAALSFFHTFSWHTREKRIAVIMTGTAVGTVLLSVLAWLVALLLLP
ncbi:MAG TPA: hypothetical protein PK916_18045 [Bacteroidota bacterium]|nr:hypothetical protein [Bacteroidota bacterium]